MPLLDASSASMSELRSLAAECRACGLCEQRKQAVFGVGSETGPWLFVGEAPGADEDEQGDPFVGQAGKRKQRPLDLPERRAQCRGEMLAGQNVIRLAQQVQNRGNQGRNQDDADHCQGPEPG